MRSCFISYARNNNADGRLGRLVPALEAHLLNYLPNGTRREDLSFLDVKSIDSGDQWMERLADATRTCKVCVCFYSMPYFTSEYCGREVAVFLQRLQAWRQLPGAQASPVRALIPVIWTKEDVPAVLQPFQDAQGGYPAQYLEEGLRALAMRKSRRDAYHTVLDLLAQRIAKVLLGEPPLPPAGPIASFDAVASVFHAQAAPVRYGIAWADLTLPGVRARPFGDGTAALDALLTQWAGEAGAPLRELSVNAKLPAAVQASGAAREMVVVVFSRAQLDSAPNAALLAQLDAKLAADSATVVLLDDGQPDAAAALAARLPQWQARAAAEATVVAADAAALSQGLRSRLPKLRAALIQADPGLRAEDPVLVKAAADAGIPLAERPVLTGPGR